MEAVRKLDILDKATLGFFPNSGEWSSFCYQQDKNLEKVNLPCHLRDSKWLAECIEKDQHIDDIDHYFILHYVKTSPFFNYIRKNYEQEIVRWQIEWMKSGGSRWVCDETYGGDLCLLTPVCDLAFRKGVVDTLLAIGMDRDAIEEGIEKNATLWRDIYMEMAFRNEFDFMLDALIPEVRVLAPVYSDEHFNAWMRLRRYEYYQNNKDAVDSYGEVSEDMLLDGEELAALREYVTMCNIRRKKEMEDFRNKNQKKLQKIAI